MIVVHIYKYYYKSTSDIIKYKLNCKDLVKFVHFIIYTTNVDKVSIKFKIIGWKYISSLIFWVI